MIRLALSLFLLLALTGCALGNAGGPYTERPFERRPGQGLYQQPQNLRPAPPQRIPANDLCKAQFYRNLVGRHEGSIYFAALPGRKRVVKPAVTESLESDFLPELNPLPPTVEIRDYLPGQSIYAPSVQTIYGEALNGPVIRERLTIELDSDGYITRVECG